MEFRVVLLLNGEYKKTLYKCKNRDTAFINYNNIKNNNNVYFPKKFINYKGIKPVKYEICITKITEDGDTFRTLRDDLGKLYTEQPLGDWTIIISEPFEMEESFWITGIGRFDRVNIREILKRLMVNAYSKNYIKQIIVVHNKLIIYNEEQFDVILCKNIQDAQRLHHTLAKISRKQKIKSLLFMGTATKATISKYYDLIHDELGWSYTKIRRTTTAHK